jgi:Ulp1 family protease
MLPNPIVLAIEK